MTARTGVVMDTGLRRGPENIRLDHDQWRAARESDAPTCHVRFHRYRPSVSLGALEAAGEAVRRDYCRRQGIEIVRRASGGGAVYLDKHQLCWTVTLAHPIAWGEGGLGRWMARLGTATARGLQAAGIPAVFASPNDIEVHGRKLAFCFMALSESALLFQGGVLFDFDAETMMKALRLPTEKLTPDGIRSARHRFATVPENAISDEMLEAHLAAAWAAELGVQFRPRVELPPAVAGEAGDFPASAEEEDDETGSWHQSRVQTRGGTLRIRLRLNAQSDRLQAVEFAGGVQVYPANLFGSLAAWLAMTPLVWLDERLEDFFRVYPHDLLGFAVGDIAHGLHLALDRHAQQIQFSLTPEQANTLMVHAPAPLSAAEVVRDANVMLVPYCAKPSWCKWRQRDGCPECGLCGVGEAYRLARERGMRVVTIVNFEHLQSTLAELKSRNTPAYLGMCCRHFYLKREYAFREAGIPAVLMDITGSNCYELQQEELAYAGKFQAQAYLDLEVLRKVLRRVPLAASGSTPRALQKRERCVPEGPP